MFKSNVDRLFLYKIFHTISSYSIVDGVAMITGSFHGTDLIVAHVCVWANLSHIIFVGSREVTLLTAKASLNLTVENYAKIHISRLYAIYSIS